VQLVRERRIRYAFRINHPFERGPAGHLDLRQFSGFHHQVENGDVN